MFFCVVKDFGYYFGLLSSVMSSSFIENEYIDWYYKLLPFFINLGFVAFGSLFVQCIKVLRSDERKPSHANMLLSVAEAMNIAVQNLPYTVPSQGQIKFWTYWYYGKYKGRAFVALFVHNYYFNEVYNF